ncbi:WhiB family transcriptional regulator [Streptomyces sp. NPDC049967]|uniref:WhiB family transcriptional regulator n=1 Tax=Streptomyces sp. NPDC049967 TaxID=3155658 RepID=UPI003429FFDA
MIELPAFLNQGPAACTDEPDLFHSTTHTDQTTATAICRTCPLRPACADYALTHPEERGTWGGLTAAERRRILLPDDTAWLDEQGRVRVACGSYRALQAHLRYGETCEPCRAAQDARIEAQRRARLAEEHRAGGSINGAAIHRRLGEPVCIGCRNAERAASAAARERRAAAERGSELALAS